MGPRVRWGVIGSGGIAFRRTIPEGIAAASNADLVAVYDPDQERNREAAKRWGGRSASSLEELLGAEIDCVYIASPADLHREHARACAEAGKHVLCEKPLGLTVEEVQSTTDLFRKKGLRLGTAFMMRFQSRHQAALDLVRRGRLGKLVYARAQLSCWYPPIEGAWRQDLHRGGGGSLMDMGGHCLDLLEMFCGPVETVTCTIRNAVQAYQPEDSAVVLASFRGGCLGTVDAFFCIPDASSENVLELYGSNGSILARNTIGQGSGGEMRALLRDDVGSGYDAQQDRSAAAEVIAPEPVNTYCAEIEEFSRALVENREPAVPGEAGLHSQRVLAACYESARTGKPVTL
jgi:predicted dehydrogenase